MKRNIEVEYCFVRSTFPSRILHVFRSALNCLVLRSLWPSCLRFLFIIAHAFLIFARYSFLIWFPIQFFFSFLCCILFSQVPGSWLETPLPPLLLNPAFSGLCSLVNPISVVRVPVLSSMPFCVRLSAFSLAFETENDPDTFPFISIFLLYINFDTHSNSWIILVTLHKFKACNILLCSFVVNYRHKIDTCNTCRQTLRR